jgi:signal transduction histidine kinase/CheY-like chemotaxis protein
VFDALALRHNNVDWQKGDEGVVDDSSHVGMVDPARKRFAGGVRSKSMLSVALPLLVLVLVVSSSLLLQSRERSQRGSNLVTAQINATSATVLLDALNAETGIRGFALTREATFLQPYYAAARRRVKDEQSLRREVLGSTSQKRVRSILALVNSRFAAFNRVRLLVVAGATDEQLTVPLREGKAVMDRLRVQIASLETYESAKELVAKNRIATLEDEVTAGELAGLLLSIIGGVLGVVYFSRSITRRLRIAVRNADRLGQGAPLEFESPSGDEFDEMDTALRNAELQLLVSSQEATNSLDAVRTSLEHSRHAEEVMILAEGRRAIAEEGRLKAESERESAESQLHQSQRLESLGQLAGGVAHDFNNLLSVILNYATFVGEELTSAGATTEDNQWALALSDVQQIHLAAERASELTHQLLAFARREVVQPRELSLNDAITGLELILRRTIGEQIDLVIDLSDNDAMVLADPGQIDQVVLNLAINARHAMSPGGALSISTAMRTITSDEEALSGFPVGSYVCLRVSDNGTGMSPEVRDRAFEPFFTTKPSGEGSGLGLATVYGIIVQSGGHIKIYSDEGVGTSITILLPVVVHDSSGATLVEDRRTRDELNGTETILVVDDEEALGEVTRRLLIRSGYQVLSASNGMQAVEIASTFDGTIDLLLTDVVMPKMQGPTVAREIRKLRPDVRVLFMSGHAYSVLEAELMLGTEFLLLEKPFDQATLLQCVRKVLDEVG